MADILTPKQRSALMARIRSAGNASTELRLVALLRAAGIRGWRRGCRLRLRGQTTVTSDQLPVAGGHEDGRGLKFTRLRRRQRRPGHRAMADGSCHHRLTTVHRLPSTVIVRPDFVFRKERLVVFVDGCFWHGCPAHYTRPKARRAGGCCMCGSMRWRRGSSGARSRG